VIGLYGGSFDPPHLGHVSVAREAKERFGLERIVILVSADPGHKRVVTPGEARLELACAAFPGDEVVLDDHARTGWSTPSASSSSRSSRFRSPPGSSGGGSTPPACRPRWRSSSPARAFTGPRTRVH
jgi:cytidyltransferase-like protein